jgi:hypothetical protein
VAGAFLGAVLAATGLEGVFPFAAGFEDFAGAALGAGFFADLEIGLTGEAFFGAFFATGRDFGRAFGVGFLNALALETGFAFGATLFTAGFLNGADFTGLEGDFPEDFRTGEEVGFFFNGALVKPKSRARKDR